MDSRFNSSKLTAYSGFFHDKEKLLQSASGGGATAISEEFIKNGGVVFGVTYSQDFKSAQFAYVDTPEDLVKLKGSKYIESKKVVVINDSTIPVYKAIGEKLQSGIKVLLIGLGCDVAGVHAYLDSQKIDRARLYAIDLICHGPTSSEVAKQYIESLEKKFKSKIISFSVRYKKKGWTPPYIFALFENGKSYDIPFYESDYGYAFSIYTRRACYNCKFRGDNHQANLTIGDYWGLTERMEGYNPDGVSIFIVNDTKGQELINSIDKNTFALAPADVEFALAHNTNYYACRKPHPKREQFEKDLKTKGLHFATKNSYGRVKYFLIRQTGLYKTIRSLTPTPVKRLIRKLRAQI